MNHSYNIETVGLISIIVILLAIIILSCNEFQTSKIFKEQELILRKEVGNYKSGNFYKDYDIFNRIGYGKLSKDTLIKPFFFEYLKNDSTIELTLFENNVKDRKMTIPKNKRVVYEFNDTKEITRHRYTKILSEKIIRFNYWDFHPQLSVSEKDSFHLDQLYPRVIEIIKKDTAYKIRRDCYVPDSILIDPESEYKIGVNELKQYQEFIYTFDDRIICDNLDVMFYDEKGRLKFIKRSKVEDELVNEDMEKHFSEMPKKRYKYWNEFY